MMWRIGSLALFVVTLGVCGQASAADEKALRLTAPVKTFAAASPMNSSMPQPAMTAQPQRPQPTTPGGKLPQYQLDPRHLALPPASQLESPQLRLILALPTGPMLLRASITIDGEPYGMARQRRVRQIMEQLAATDAVSSDEIVPRIRRYLKATDTAPAAEEVRWLLTNWVDGPALLLLNDNFQRFRASQRPVFHVLDQDRDGIVSAAELKRAVASFQECDLNRDQIIEYTELADAADDPRRKQPQLASPGTRLLLLPNESNAAATYRRLAVHYSSKESAIVPRWDANTDGRFDADELATLHSAAEDVDLTVTFHSSDTSQSQIAVRAESGRADGTTITLELGGALLALSAVQDGASDQISLGAVEDGYPLLPLLDPNEDGRFTVRELRGLVQRLSQVDRNGDGRLTDEETSTTIRLCFGLGPHVHRELAGIRQVQLRPTKPAVAGPEWFVRMDRNKDNDLTRGEFPGTDEQFAQLDGDRDELISAEEALVMENNSAAK